ANPSPVMAFPQTSLAVLRPYQGDIILLPPHTELPHFVCKALIVAPLGLSRRAYKLLKDRQHASHYVCNRRVRSSLRSRISSKPWPFPPSFFFTSGAGKPPVFTLGSSFRFGFWRVSFCNATRRRRSGGVPPISKPQPASPLGYFSCLY